MNLLTVGYWPQARWNAGSLGEDELFQASVGFAEGTGMEIFLHGHFPDSYRWNYLREKPSRFSAKAAGSVPAALGDGVGGTPRPWLAQL